MNNQLKTQDDLLRIFKDYNVLIYNYIYFRVNKNKEVAEDLAQEAFIKAWKYRENFDPKKSSLKTWLFVITKNLIIDSYRKSREVNFEFTNLEESGASLDNDVLKSFVFERMKDLEANEQELILLKYVNGLSVKEISKIIDKNYVATKVSIHRAFNKLKKIIHEQRN